MPDICYICGLAINTDKSVDHLPPKQFYAPSLRTSYNLSKLVTLPAHGKCNKSYESDEEYFTWSLCSLAIGSEAADALVREQGRLLRSRRKGGLARTVLAEYQRRPSGIILPGQPSS